MLVDVDGDIASDSVLCDAVACVDVRGVCECCDVVQQLHVTYAMTSSGAVEDPLN